MKRLHLLFVLLISLTGSLPARAADPTMAEMMYAMGKMMAVMMGHFVGAMNESSGSANVSPYLNFSSGMSGWPGLSAWPTAWNLPLSGMAPWPGTGYGFPGMAGLPLGGWNRYGVPRSNVPYRILQGRWIGASGDQLDLSGNHFRLWGGPYVLSGRYMIDDDHLLLYPPETGRLTEYRFAYRPPVLELRDSYGQILLFRRLGSYPFSRY